LCLLGVLKMKEVIAWEDAKRKMEQFGIEYLLTTNYIALKNKVGASLGHFQSGTAVYEYMCGYESGLMDSKLFSK